MFTKSLVLLVITCTFYACSSSSAGDDSDADAGNAARLSYVELPETRVVVTPVKRGAFELELVSNGQLEAQRKAVVPFVVQEQINAVHVREGERVSAGQLLGSVEPFTYQKRLEEAQNKYQQSLIDLEDRLLGFGYQIQDTAKIPEDHLRMAKLRSGFNSAVIALEEARRNFETTSINAPIGGVVTNLEARVHNPSSAFQKFCDILDLSSMHLVFYLLETELAGVEQGQLVELRPFALQGERFEGRVSSINPMVDEKGMVRITAIVPNKGERLMDGMNARVLLKKQIPNCLVIPKSAVLYRQNRKVVFVFEDGKSIWKYVETGHENSTHVAVNEGLEEGMEVIYENNLNLAHESLVTRTAER